MKDKKTYIEIKNITPKMENCFFAFLSIQELKEN